jgi:endo-1,4-beta-xylanase
MYSGFFRGKAMNARARFLLFATLTLTALGFTSAQTSPGLRALADARGILIGTAVDPGVLFDTLEPEYAKILFKEFSVITPENAMKFSSLSSARGQYSFSGSDALVAMAAKNNQRVRGHTLIWHEQLPIWLVKEISAKGPSREYMMNVMKQHISAVAGHFAGKLAYWDVVNEAVTEDGKLRATPWLKAIGPDYIAKAFVMARAADPKAKLCYNDYNTDGFNPKSDRVYALVKELKAQNAPIDCVGFQAHLDQNFNTENARVRENLERFAGLGVEVQLTEVDVQLKGSAPEADRLAAQARVYADLLNACLDVKGCTAFVMWGFTDAHSWRSGNEPLIYDSGYAAKPAYDALKRALENKPK